MSTLKPIGICFVVMVITMLFALLGLSEAVAAETPTLALNVPPAGFVPYSMVGIFWGGRAY